MKLVLDNVSVKHKHLMFEMAKALNFDVSEIALTDKEEEEALMIAIEEGKTEGRATEKEQDDFNSWLKSL